MEDSQIAISSPVPPLDLFELEEISNLWSSPNRTVDRTEACSLMPPLTSELLT